MERVGLSGTELSDGHRFEFRLLRGREHRLGSGAVFDDYQDDERGLIMESDCLPRADMSHRSNFQIRLLRQ